MERGTDAAGHVKGAKGNHRQAAAQGGGDSLDHTMTHLCGQRALVLNSGGQIRSTQGAGAVRGHTHKAGGKG